MARLQIVEPADAQGRSRELLEETRKSLGTVPVMFKALANSPAALGAYKGMMATLADGALDAKLREQIALAVAEANGCDYCLAAHGAVGKLVGLSAEQVRDARLASSPDRATEAALVFARTLVEARGLVDDDDVDAVREAGYDDGAIAEIIAHVGLNLFSNYFNHVAATEVDFPAAEPLAGERVARAV